MSDFAAAETRLKAQLAELNARQGRIVQDLSEPPDRDWEDLAIESEDDEPLEQQGALIEREIASVKRALTRIESGTYGACVRCGGTIAAARLEARPEAALCFACAEQADQRSG